MVKENIATIVALLALAINAIIVYSTLAEMKLYADGLEKRITLLEEKRR